jgi:hypothetical protein
VQINRFKSTWVKRIQRKALKLTATLNLKTIYSKIALGVEANTPQQHAAKRNVARSIAEDPQKALNIRILKGFNQDRCFAGNV